MQILPFFSNAALPGGFEKQFPLYTIRVWNQTEVEDDFRDWDAIPWMPLRRTRQRPEKR